MYCNFWIMDRNVTYYKLNILINNLLVVNKYKYKYTPQSS